MGSYKIYNIATKKMVAEYTRKRESKTLMQLGKISYNCKCLDNKR